MGLYANDDVFLSMMSDDTEEKAKGAAAVWGKELLSAVSLCFFCFVPVLHVFLLCCIITIILLFLCCYWVACCSCVACCCYWVACSVSDPGPYTDQTCFLPESESDQ